MTDAVEGYLTASTANDVDGILATLTPDAELVSPLGNMVFRGEEDLRVVFAAIYGTLAGLRWHTTLADGNVRVLLGGARIGPLALEDAMVMELADDGRIRRVKPHLRPLPAILFLMFALGPKIARRPGVVRRSMRHARRGDSTARSR